MYRIHKEVRKFFLKSNNAYLCFDYCMFFLQKQKKINE